MSMPEDPIPVPDAGQPIPDHKSWREELTPFELAVPFALRKVLDPGFDESVGTISVIRAQAKKLFAGFADGPYRRAQDIENLTVDILLRSVSHGDWATIPKIQGMHPMAHAMQGLLTIYEAQQRSLEYGLLEEVLPTQGVEMNPQLRPTKKLVDGIVARISGNEDYKIIPPIF